MLPRVNNHPYRETRGKLVTDGQVSLSKKEQHESFLSNCCRLGR